MEKFPCESLSDDDWSDHALFNFYRRFGCNTNLNVCNSGGTCMTLNVYSSFIYSFFSLFIFFLSRVKVVDAGPGQWVEEDAGWAIIDASQDACQNLYVETLLFF